MWFCLNDEIITFGPNTDGYFNTNSITMQIPLYDFHLLANVVNIWSCARNVIWSNVVDHSREIKYTDLCECDVILTAQVWELT